MLFALMAVPIVSVIGLAVDFREISNAKSEGQDAMDAGVMAAARAYGENFEETLELRKTIAKQAGQDAFKRNLEKSTQVSWADVQFSISDDHHVTGTANVSTKTTFSALMGKDKLDAAILSQAIAGDARPFEIVLVLDNTTSMFNGTRMEDMREAAKTFTEIMYTSSPDPTLTRISVIPTASLVNINMERPAVWTAAVDSNSKKTPAQTAAGSRLVPPAPFENRLKYLSHPDTGSNLNASSLEDLFEPVEWRGCIRTADNERKVTSGGFVLGSLDDTPAPGMRWPAARLAPELDMIWVNEAPPPPPPPPPTDDDDDDDDDDDEDDDDYDDDHDDDDDDAPKSPPPPPPHLVFKGHWTPGNP